MIGKAERSAAAWVGQGWAGSGHLAGWAGLPMRSQGLPRPARPLLHMDLSPAYSLCPPAAQVPGRLRGLVWHTLEALETLHAATETAFPRKLQPASCRRRPAGRGGAWCGPGTPGWRGRGLPGLWWAGLGLLTVIQGLP